MKSIFSQDPGLMCFRHCKSQIFTTGIPSKCPECSTDIHGDTSLMPFRLPFPFGRSHDHPCSIVLRPTHGDFLNEYFNSMNLHIGVTDSRGCVVEFDKRGLTKSNGRIADQWKQSLVVESIPEAWHEHWDNVLATMFNVTNENWRAERYNEDKHNCYSFVLEFLRQLGYGTLSELAQNRTQFCEQYIIPRTTAAGKYISLYRKIRDHGFYIHSTASTMTKTETATTTKNIHSMTKL